MKVSTARRVAIVALAIALGAGSSGAQEIGEWTTTGPEGGWVTVLFDAYGDGTRLYAGTYGGGVFLSEDEGRSWRNVTGNLGGWVIHDIEGSGQAEHPIYVATEEDGLWRSGVTVGRWGPASAGLGRFGIPVSVHGIAIHPENPGTMSLATFNGLYTTDSFAQSWPDSLHYLPQWSLTDVEVTDTAPPLLYIMGPQTVIRTGNRGNIIKLLHEGLPGTFSMDLEIWPGTRETVLVANFRNGAYMTEDGKRFRHIGPVADPQKSPLLRTVEIAASTGEIYLGSERGVHITADRGESWEFFDHGLDTEWGEVWSILLRDPASRELLVGSFGRGVMRTYKDKTWEAHNTGLVATWVMDMATEGDRILVATRNGRLFVSEDAGGTWEDRTGSIDTLGFLTVALERGGDRWLAFSLNGSFTSHDQGQSWTRPATGFELPAPALDSTQPEWLPPGVIYAGTTQGAFWSDDFGARWHPVPGFPEGMRVSVVEQSSGDRRIWLAADGVGVFQGEHRGEFTDQGIAPDPVMAFKDLIFPTGLGNPVLVATDRSLMLYDDQYNQPVRMNRGLPEDASPTDLLLEEKSGEYFVSLAEGGVYRVAELGQRWSPWNEGLIVDRVLCLAASGVEGRRIHLGTFAAGVYSRELPIATPVLLPAPVASWLDGRVRIEARVALDAESGHALRLRLSRSLPGADWARIEELAAAPSIGFDDELEDLELRAGVEIRYRLELLDGDGLLAESYAALSVPGDAPPRHTTQLLGNHPNPFNPRTSVELELAAAGDVLLEVFDLRGRRVRRLFEGSLPAGPTSFRWQGVDDRGVELPSGVYLLRMRAAGQVFSHRMTLLR